MFETIVIILIIAIPIIISGLFTVKQQTIALVERFGKFNTTALPGLQFKVPLIDNVVGRVSMKIQQLDVMVETKTKDDVFVKLKVSVQYNILKDKVFDAFYKLELPEEQITSYVFDTIRAEVPKMKLDEVFERKDDIAIATRRELEEAMKEYGYGIVKALVTDIDPDAEVKIAMNRINASEREKLAAEYEAEADKIRIIAKAKAEAESKRLQGKGTADQRREIAKGLEDSVDVLNKVGINSQEASALIVITQHYDTLQAMGESTNSNLILLPNSPSAASDMLSQMVTSFAASKQIGEQMNQKKAVALPRESKDKVW